MVPALQNFHPCFFLKRGTPPPIQGNEYSYYMLLTSSFMLNCIDRKEAVNIYPWVRHPRTHPLSLARAVAPCS